MSSCRGSPHRCSLIGHAWRKECNVIAAPTKFERSLRPPNVGSAARSKTKAAVLGVGCALLFPALIAATAHGQAAVTDYLVAGYYPAQIAAINFGPRIDGHYPQAQRLSHQQPMTIGRWQVALAPAPAPATYQSMRHHIKLVPWWGVRIHTSCHPSEGGQQRHCYFEFFERGGSTDCILRMHQESGHRDGTVDDIEIGCPISIEFANRLQ